MHFRIISEEFHHIRPHGTEMFCVMNSKDEWAKCLKPSCSSSVKPLAIATYILKFMARGILQTTLRQRTEFPCVKVHYFTYVLLSLSVQLLVSKIWFFISNVRYVRLYWSNDHSGEVCSLCPVVPYIEFVIHMKNVRPTSYREMAETKRLWSKRTHPHAPW